jgi:hypothetical protein
MKEACSFCKRRLGRRPTEVAALTTIGADRACDDCLTTLATVALRKLPRANAFAAQVTRELSKVATAAEAEQTRARLLEGAHFPDLIRAVEGILHVIEYETATPSTERNHEVLAGAREALQALIHTKHVPTAKRFLDEARAGLL